MKVTELRIGNWAMGNKPFQITAANIAHAALTESQNLDTGWQPIPLTEEWLERFGLKIECMWVNDCKAVKGDFHITLDHDGETVIGYPTSIGIRNQWMFVQDIEYVHQLQNLYFALTGEELELKP